ncbi:FimV/HubP family polar landmark protein [Moritella dasanensis]|uniref:FimV/HubP family polar landmark protein n=1 Tax=Moritella dasanensis TaxID=428031 RepID=UPI0002FB6F4D|nr:FimV/HubP family polar landmark protein [Moritella dasanensis]
MISVLSKLKWVVLFLLLPMASIAANSNGFVLQLKGPEVHTPSSPSRYGPVVKADTLWSVATATRPNDSLSLYKTMAAILALNPHAFLNGDINKMIDGSFLKIPSAAEIQATDGSRLKSLLTNKSNTKAASTSKPATSKPKGIAKNKQTQDKFALLQGELTESNEHLLLSSETNRRLKLQLESIRMELAELKEQMAIDNQLKTELKALIEQQNAQISEQKATIEEAKEQAILEAESHNNWWLIGGVSGLFSLLSIIWLGLWLKNRNDQKNNIEDNVMFETDNSVDELSDYLSTESFAGATGNPEDAQSSMEQSNEINSFSAPDLDEPNFNLQMEAELADVVSHAPTAVVTQSSTPIMPEVIEQAVVMPELNLDDNDFSDIDLTLDDESTSFENDSVAPDLSWRDELDEPSLIPDQPAHNGNTLDEDLAEVDDLLEQFKLGNSQPPDFDVNALDDADVTATNDPETAPEPVVNDEFVNMDDIDSILAEADSAANNQSQNPAPDEFVNMDDIDSILAEAELEAIAQADNVPNTQPQTPVQNEVVDMDDIDNLLAEAGLDAIAQSEAENATPNLDNQQTVDMDDIDSLLAAAGADNNVPAATVTAPSSLDNFDVDVDVDVDDIDSILASAGLDTPVKDIGEDSSIDNDELPQAHGQTVDEMLAELDGAANATPEAAKQSNKDDDAPLDDIEAMLAEYSPNAFSEAPSEQAPIDVEAAKAEEFIDIDKLLNDASQQPAAIEDEPYDQVTLDVGLDEYSNSLFDSDIVDVDDESNRLGAQLDLARAYLEIEDKDGAKSILEPLAGVGDAATQAEVSKLLSRL